MKNYLSVWPTGITLQKSTKSKEPLIKTEQMKINLEKKTKIGSDVAKQFKKAFKQGLTSGFRLHLRLIRRKKA